MADKSFIEFRLDPDNIKEELSQLIPYYETLKYYHENPDAPISETAKVALNETPFIGSLLRGEPVDAAKEAFIMGLTPTKIKSIQEYVKKHPKSTYTNAGNELYDISKFMDDEIAKKPGHRGNYAQELEDKMDDGQWINDYDNVNEVLTDLNESAKIPSSPYDFDKPLISKAKELNYEIHRLKNLKDQAIEMKDKMKKDAYENYMNNLNLEIKKTMADINKHNIEMEFAPEFEKYGAPHIDDNFYSDLIKKLDEYYLDATKNIKYPYKE